MILAGALYLTNFAAPSVALVLARRRGASWKRALALCALVATVGAALFSAAVGFLASLPVLFQRDAMYFTVAVGTFAVYGVGVALIGAVVPLLYATAKALWAREVAPQ